MPVIRRRANARHTSIRSDREAGPADRYVRNGQVDCRPRLGGRRYEANNSYGKVPEKFRRFPGAVETVELLLLRQIATHDIRTTMPLNDVVTTVLKLVDP
jgi:hypothetical protein